MSHHLPLVSMVGRSQAGLLRASYQAFSLIHTVTQSHRNRSKRLQFQISKEWLKPLSESEAQKPKTSPCFKLAWCQTEFKTLSLAPKPSTSSLRWQLVHTRATEDIQVWSKISRKSWKTQARDVLRQWLVLAAHWKCPILLLHLGLCVPMQSEENSNDQKQNQNEGTLIRSDSHRFSKCKTHPWDIRSDQLRSAPTHQPSVQTIQSVLQFIMLRPRALQKVSSNKGFNQKPW